MDIKDWMKHPFFQTRPSDLILNSDATLSVNVAALRQSTIFKEQILAARRISVAQGLRNEPLVTSGPEVEPIESD